MTEPTDFSGLVVRLRADADRHLDPADDGDWSDAHGPARVSSANLECEAADAIERLSAALERYGKHVIGPDVVPCLAHIGKACTCGLSEALAGAELPEKS